MEVESEFEAQLLKALPSRVQRHQAQSFPLGTVNTYSQIDIGSDSLPAASPAPILGVLDACLCPHSIPPTQACAHPAVSGVLYKRRNSSISVLPFGSATDRVGGATAAANAADADIPGLSDACRPSS